jgi:signal transduction histidine kinase
MQIVEDPGTGKRSQQRIDKLVESLSKTGPCAETLATLAHDARNMVTALSLYCDLLEEPGVLASAFLHYGNELRLVTAASRRLVEKLVLLDAEGTEAGTRTHERHAGGSIAIPVTGTIVGCGSQVSTGQVMAGPAASRRAISNQSIADDINGNFPIKNLAEELRVNRNLLDALAGLPIALTVDTEGGELPVRLTSEDLTRILVNMVKNAAEAIRSAGTIHIALREWRAAEGGPVSAVRLTVEDSGPGIAPELVEKIFEPGFTTRRNGSTANHLVEQGFDRARDASYGWDTAHRGLGLSITRSIIEAAGGRITVTNGSLGGASFEIELPVRSR